jgi:L-threonylcarbamoyladenylate synthase
VKRWSIADAPTAAQIQEIAAALLGGAVLLLPTDTIYGLHALYGSAGVDRIRAMKGREENKPFVTIAADVSQLEKIGAEVPDALRDLWPGPITGILRNRNGGTIAARIPDLDWMRALLAQTGPLISTSANRSGEPPITMPSALAHDLQIAQDGVVDAGLRDGKPSAIVDFTGDEPRLIREGDPRFTQNLRKTLRKTL